MERAPVDVARELAHTIEIVLGDRLVALYLYGSAVTGDFIPGVSDIDLCAVTADELDENDLRRIEDMHAAFVVKRPEWNDRIEVVYLSRSTLAEYQSSTGRLAVISPGEPFHVRPDRARSWVQNWYLLREMSMPLVGPAATEIIPTIGWAKFVDGAREYAREIRDRIDSEAEAGALAYEVLTICRLLRNVRTGVIGSKTDSADWARVVMPEWTWLIDEAVATRASRGATGFERRESRAKAAEFVRLQAERIESESASSL